MGRTKGEERLVPTKRKQLEELFLLGGTTPTHAAKLAGVDHKTVAKYWQTYADKIVEDENHEDWFEREERVRKRALEGLAIQVNTQRQTLEPFEKMLVSLQKGKNIDELERIERIVRLNRENLSELIDRFDAIEMSPPMKILLEKEVEAKIAAKLNLNAT